MSSGGMYKGPGGQSLHGDGREPFRMPTDPIDWQARCLKVEGELATLTERTKEVEKEWDRRFELLIDQRNSSRAELTLIKGRQEWGITTAGFIVYHHASEVIAREDASEDPGISVVSRYSCGPWVPVAKEGE